MFSSPIIHDLFKVTQIELETNVTILSYGPPSSHAVAFLSIPDNTKAKNTVIFAESILLPHQSGQALAFMKLYTFATNKTSLHSEGIILLQIVFSGTRAL